MSARQHLKAFNEGIRRATLIKRDLAKHPTEYFPEKVRGLNAAYLATVKEIMRQGELYLDTTSDLEEGMRVAITIENYRGMLSALPRRKES